LSPFRLNATLRRLFRTPVYFYRLKCGWLLGHRFLMLIQVGRRSGLRRYTILEVMEYRKELPEMVVMSAFGRNSDWLRNIEASPSLEVVIDTKRFPAVYRTLDEAEATAVIAGYERRNRLIAPIVRAALSGLVGWRYDGSEQARRRLAAQRPLIAFRPRSHAALEGDGHDSDSLQAGASRHLQATKYAGFSIRYDHVGSVLVVECLLG
jgi:deazaflavin-dependent oxidoreductase (nitroreductase family)